MTDPCICICFEDLEISELFAFLIESQGVTARIIEHPTQCSVEDKLVTERQFLGSVPGFQAQKCLLVGERNKPFNFPGMYLSQPLTEDGVEEALSRLLEA